MKGKIFFWVLLLVLAASLTTAVVGLVGEFNRFQDRAEQTDAPPADTAVAEVAEVAQEEQEPAAEASAQDVPATTARSEPETAALSEPEPQAEAAQDTAPATAPASSDPNATAAGTETDSQTEAGLVPQPDSETEASAAAEGLPIPRRKPEPPQPEAQAASETASPSSASQASESQASESQASEASTATQVAALQPASGFRLGPPLACNPGKDCWVSTYFDHDTSTGRKDHACGLISYDTHGGIDFAIANLAVMQRGVSVIASAAGKVVGTRDSMADVNMDDADPASIKGRDCGNGVRVDHGNGWSTQYCHMKRGSIIVRSGQQVAAGEVLGQVGLSGRTQHPHVHISVLKDGKKVDPYTGAGAGEAACGDTSGTLWAPETARDFSYRTGLIRDALFSLGVPDRKTVKAGTAGSGTGSTDSPELVLWTETMGTLRDHTVTIEIKAPGGQTVAKKAYTEPKVYAALGIRGRRPQSGWPAGTYTGVIEIRNGQNQVTDTRQVTIELK